MRVTRSHSLRSTTIVPKYVGLIPIASRERNNKFTPEVDRGSFDWCMDTQTQTRCHVGKTSDVRRRTLMAIKAEAERQGGCIATRQPTYTSQTENMHTSGHSNTRTGRVESESHLTRYCSVRGSVVNTTPVDEK